MKNRFKKLLFLTFLALIFYSVNAFSDEINQEALKTSQEVKNSETAEIPLDKNGKPLTGKDLKIYNLAKNALIYTPTDFTPVTKETKTDFFDMYMANKQTVFENGDTYSITRIYFKEKSETRYTTSLKIEGNTIAIRYLNPKTKEWVNTSNLSNLMYTTLFIDTDTSSYVVSVPAVYKNDFKNNTLTVLSEKEEMVKIEKSNGYYTLSMSFPKDPDVIGEFWTVSSSSRLVDWSLQKSFDDLIAHDLSNERRWSYDGYYFVTPSNYVPGGEGILYRHPSNYTGSSWVKYSSNNLSKNLGYVMTETCMQNQNSYGYWETGPKSLWLETDFNIKESFYDTRFNTDFAVSLLYAYQNYNNKEFLISALKYAEFFIEHANKNSYKVDGGGILVQDYAYHKGTYEANHVSLNHQLAEINFLYRLYIITKEQTYFDLAEEMLLGIENTRNKWVLSDSNLKYALMYNKTTNEMVDYPYLTYNDLYETKSILKTYFNKTNDTVEFLMAAKKQWMDKNNVKGYLGYKN